MAASANSTANSVNGSANGSAVLAPPPAPTAAPALLCTVQCRAAQALKQSSHPALRRLRVEETEQAIIISGRVATYYLKQLAQETIMSVRRDLALVNEVTVVKD